MAHEDHRVAVAHHALDPARVRPRDAPVDPQEPCASGRRRAGPARARWPSASRREYAAPCRAAPTGASLLSPARALRAGPRGGRRRARRRRRSTSEADRSSPVPLELVSSTADGVGHQLQVGPHLGDRHRRHLAGDLGLGDGGCDGAKGGDVELEPGGRLVVHARAIPGKRTQPPRNRGFGPTSSTPGSPWTALKCPRNRAITRSGLRRASWAPDSRLPRSASHRTDCHAQPRRCIRSAPIWE